MDFLPDVIDARFLIVQGIGAAGFLLYILSFQWLQPRRTILQQSAANFILAFHFYGLGSILVTYLAAIACVRDLGSAYLNARHQRFWMAGYMLLLGVAAVFLVEGVAGWFGVVGSVMSAMSQLFRERFYVFRALSFVHQSLWLVMYVIILSLPGIVVALFAVISNAMGIVRYMRKGEV